MTGNARLIVTIRVPRKLNREPWEAWLVVDEGYVIDAESPLRFMCGWSGDAIRTYCKSVGWTATVAKDERR